MNFYSQLERIVKLQPQNSAIFWDGGKLNYLEFCNLANSIGSALSKKFKLKKGGNVALVMENNYLLLPILFGIWKAGLTSVPINAKLHKKELSWIFENSDTKLIFCSQDKIPDIHSNVPVIVNFSKELGEVVIDELEKLNLLYRNRGISDKRDFIIKRIAAVELDLENSEDNLKSFRERNQQVNSPSLLLEQERLMRELDIQKGIYLTLKQQLEMNKIEEVQKASIIQVLDYPNLPLDPSNQKNKIKILLISIFIGFSSGILISLIREYIEHSHPNTRRQLRSGKNLVFKKIKTLYTDSRIAGIMSIFLLIGLPFFLSHQSLEPKFFGRYSTQAILINLFYILLLIRLLFLYRNNKKRD